MGYSLAAVIGARGVGFLRLMQSAQADHYIIALQEMPATSMPSFSNPPGFARRSRTSPLMFA